MSKKLIFSSGKEINISECYGKSEFVQGSQRDVLDFRFNPEEITLNEVDALFTTSECVNLTIVETTTSIETVMVDKVDEEGNPVLDEEGNHITEPTQKEVEHVSEFRYTNYGLRVALSKQAFTLATENGAHNVDQISVKMGQFTYTELQVSSLTDTVDVLVMESLMG